MSAHAPATSFGSGSSTITAVHTPGHTPNHLSYVARQGGSPVAAFTGGSMLYGTVGRTDLISAEETEPLTRAQFQSVRRLATDLAEDVAVYPTHGFGSFCSSASTSGRDSSTIGDERRSNIALTMADEGAFVEHLLSGLTAYPRYYAYMADINRGGPPPIDLDPPTRLDSTEVRRRIHDGEWVVDLRSRSAFARSHVAGTINVEVGGHFSTYLGWTIPWGTPVTLVGDTADEVAEAQRQLVRIGIDRPAGFGDGGPDDWGRDSEMRSYRSARFTDLATESKRDGVLVLDVRRDDEWAAGGLAGALHIPLHDLEARIGEIPGDREVWVHCASGYRASIAASLLDRAGLRVVAVDDDWAAASQAGLSVRDGS